MRNTLRTQHIARKVSHAAHCAPPAQHTHGRKTTNGPTRRDAAESSTRRQSHSLTSCVPTAPHSAQHTATRNTPRTQPGAPFALTNAHTPSRAPTRLMQHAPSPPPPRTRLRLARRPHRTVRSTLRTQLIARRLLITRAHTQPCATRHARNTMRAIRTHTMRSPSAAHSARQAPRPGSHANAAGMPAARLPPSRPRRPHASAAGMPAAPRLPPSPGTPPHRPLASATGGGSTSDPVLAQARKRPRTTKLGTSRLSLSERPLQGRPHYHTEEMSERSGTHTHRATASFHPRLDRGPLSALSGAWSGTVALPNRSPGPGKPGGGVTNFALIAGRVTQRTPQPAVRLRLGRGGLQRDTAAAAPTRCARRSALGACFSTLASHTARAHSPATAQHPAPHLPPVPPLAPS